MSVHLADDDLDVGVSGVAGHSGVGGSGGVFVVLADGVEVGDGDFVVLCVKDDVGIGHLEADLVVDGVGEGDRVGSGDDLSQDPSFGVDVAHLDGVAAFCLVGGNGGQERRREFTGGAVGVDGLVHGDGVNVAGPVALDEHVEGGHGEGGLLLAADGLEVAGDRGSSGVEHGVVGGAGVTLLGQHLDGVEGVAGHVGGHSDGDELAGIEVLEAEQAGAVDDLEDFLVVDTGGGVWGVVELEEEAGDAGVEGAVGVLHLGVAGDVTVGISQELHEVGEVAVGFFHLPPVESAGVVVEGHGLDLPGGPVDATDLGDGVDLAGGVVPFELIEVGAGLSVAQVDEVEVAVEVAGDGDRDGVAEVVPGGVGVVVQRVVHVDGAFAAVDFHDLVDAAVLGAEHTVSWIVVGHVVHVQADGVDAAGDTAFVVDHGPTHAVVVGVTGNGGMRLILRVGPDRVDGVFGGTVVPVVVPVQPGDVAGLVDGVVHAVVVVLWRDEHAVSRPGLGLATHFNALQMN